MNKINPYVIKEIFPGHYYMMLDMLDTSDVLKIISDDYRYLWFYDVETNPVRWKKVNITCYDKPLNDTWIRNVNLECIVETTHVKDVLYQFDCGVSLVQLNELPPPYMRMSKTTMSEKTKYDQLRKLGYLLSLHIPRPSDYGWIICSSLDYLQKIIKILTA